MSFQQSLAIGVMGNVPGHISGAENIKEGTRPTGVFIFYAPNIKSDIGVYSLTSGDIIKHPRKGEKIQVEPEVILDCSVSYKNNGYMEKITPNRLSIGNDFSIRKLEGTTKLSQRKQWGPASKGFKDYWWNLDSSLTHSDFGDEYKLMSYVKRDNLLHEYTLETSWSEHKLFYMELLDWIVETFNTQQDEGVKDDLIHDILQDNIRPTQLFIYAGAPDYTKWGHENCIKVNDEVIITTYNSNEISLNQVKENIIKGNVSSDESIIYFSQKVA